MNLAPLSILFATAISATYTNTSTIEDISFTTINNNDTVLCSDFGFIENGNWTPVGTYIQPLVIHAECKPGYDLVGPSIVTCIHGQWDSDVPLACEARCFPPAHVKYGLFTIEGKKSEDDGMYVKGTLVTYSCPTPYELEPDNSKYRVCEKGIWTGAMGTCRLLRNMTSCRPPPGITHGYVHEKLDRINLVGQQIRYVCNFGYVMIGDAVKICTPDGTWSPKFLPMCSSPKTENLEELCPMPVVSHAKITDIQRFQSLEAGSLVSGTEVDIECELNYRNARAPCQSARLRCLGGKWVGLIPKCEVVKECPQPPSIPHAVSFASTNFLLEGYGPRAYKYPINSKGAYQCIPGFETLGIELTCAPNGCWVPSEPPPLCRIAKRYYLEVASSASNAIPTTGVLVSFATGVTILLLLIVVCLVLVYRRRKHSASSASTPLRRSAGGVLSGGVVVGGVVGGAGVVGRVDNLADHATLLQQQDRLALIAFADGGGGMRGGQPVLPTYEEATRERLSVSNRMQRPHWPSLMVGRRSRNSPNPDSVHVTRQGSFASHSASTRSGADSMGSTDTMAVSENSTTVTLDTASSHSGSQPASCRAHCGSLASFDTSSVLNTEGVPLLEESELEEIQCGDTVSLAMENRSMTDNASYKFSTASDVA